MLQPEEQTWKVVLQAALDTSPEGALYRLAIKHLKGQLSVKQLSWSDYQQIILWVILSFVSTNLECAHKVAIVFTKTPWVAVHEKLISFQTFGMLRVSQYSLILSRKGLIYLPSMRVGHSQPFSLTHSHIE